MEFFHNLLRRLKQAWSTMSFNQRAIVGMVGIAATVSLFVFSTWIESDSMVVLSSGLDGESASGVMDFLDKEGATYRVGAGGRTIEVAADEVDRLRLRIAGEGLIGDGHGSWADFIGNGRVGATQRELDAAERYAMEGELARSIETLDAVQHARVHINLPPRTGFLLRGDRASSASVIITLRRRTAPTREQVESIQYMVSGYVPRLDPSDVAVIETSTGRALAGLGGDSSTARSNEQLRAQQEVESYLAGKANTMLANILGAGRYSVSVGADLDFEELERIAEIYDPNTVVRSEGTAESEDPTKSKGITNYEVNKTVDRILRNGSTLKKLTVSVAVDGTYATPATEGDAPVYSPRTDQEITQIQTLVAGAVGLDPGRGDSIEVVSMQFNTPQPYEPGLMDQMHWLQDLPNLVGRFLLFVVAAILVLGLRKSLSQALGEAATPGAGVRQTGSGPRAAAGAAASPEMFHGVHAEVATLEDWARGDPDQVADLVKAFATQED